MNLTIERDEATQELDRVTHHRDTALELAEERRRGWILANHNAFQREQALQGQLEELQVEHHQLHNRLFPIPRTKGLFPLVADDLLYQGFYKYCLHPAGDEDQIMGMISVSLI